MTLLVHLVGLEPTLLAELEPKSSVSAIPPQMRKSLPQLVAVGEEDPRPVGEGLLFGERPGRGELLEIL